MRPAANRVAAGSRMRRTCTSSSVKSSSSKSAAAPIPASNSSGRKLVTNVPSPRRISRTRAVTRARTASRIVLRPVPNDSASSASGGRRSPGDEPTRGDELADLLDCSFRQRSPPSGSPPSVRTSGLDMGCLECVWYSVSSTVGDIGGSALGEVAMSTLANVGHPSEPMSSPRPAVPPSASPTPWTASRTRTPLASVAATDCFVAP